MNRERILEFAKDYGHGNSLFFEKDTRNNGRGWVYNNDPYVDYYIHGYPWKIQKSNSNIDKNGFSFYLAYFALKGHTFFEPLKGSGTNFNECPYCKITGFLFENPHLGLVEITFSGRHTLGNIIASAKEVFNDDIALYIREKTKKEGYRNWGYTEENMRKTYEAAGSSQERIEELLAPRRKCLKWFE